MKEKIKRIATDRLNSKMKHIRLLLFKNEMTLSDVAKGVGLSHTTLYNNMKKGNMTYINLLKIEAFLEKKNNRRE